MLDRRALLGGAAALVSTTAVVSASPAPSALDELIADYRWAKEALSEAQEYWDNLHEALCPPIPFVRFGKRRLTNPETGSVSHTKWVASYPHEIERHFEPCLRHMFGGAKQIARAKTQKARLLRELRRKWEAYENALSTTGITAAEHAVAAAEREVLRLEDEILTYRSDEFTETLVKIRFLLREMESEQLSQKDMATVLRALLPASTKAA